MIHHKQGLIVDLREPKIVSGEPKTEEHKTRREHFRFKKILRFIIILLGIMILLFIISLILDFIAPGKPIFK
jgi:hypothetical protein